MTTAKIFKVLVEHYAPKDSHASLQGFVVANSSLEVAKFVLTRLDHYDLDDLASSIIQVYDDDGNPTERMSRLDYYASVGGELFSDCIDTSDAYYGKVAYGWRDMGPATTGLVDLLTSLDVLLADLTQRPATVDTDVINR